MDRRDEFQRLTAEWQRAKQANALAQMALDLKISSFLAGFGEPPTIDEQNEVDSLRAREAERLAPPPSRKRIKRLQFFHNLPCTVAPGTSIGAASSAIHLLQAARIPGNITCIKNNKHCF